MNVSMINAVMRNQMEWTKKYKKKEEGDDER